MTPADITKTDPAAADFLRRADERSRSGYYRQFSELMPPGKPRVLDVGCGDGVATLAVAPRAALVVGLDISPTMIALARRRPRESGAAPIAWVIASADALPFRSESFDYIISARTLRFSNLDLSLPDLRRVAAPRARIVVDDNTEGPLRFGFWPWHIRRTLKTIPTLFRLYGWRGTWRVLMFNLSAPGVRSARQNRRLSPSGFVEIYQRHFPESAQRVRLAPGSLVWDNQGEDS